MPRLNGNGISPGEVGVFGESQEAEGVRGVGHKGAGVSGSSEKWIGTYGESQEAEGVRGFSRNGAGVSGSSERWIGTYGESKEAEGVRGVGHRGAGVSGSSEKWIGTYGESQEADGVRGVGHKGAGVSGISEQWIGAYGESQLADGVYGKSKTGRGVVGVADGDATGVEGRSEGNGAGIYGSSKSGPAGYFAGDVHVTGDITLNNADCAEDFDVCESLHIEPGTVMVLGEEGLLCPSGQAYDKRVVGVVSGAGGYKPGIVLDKQTSETSRMPIALLGKVYCKVDAQQTSIEVGDLLTTSAIPGHAMKANDHDKAFGSVIGKALRPLKAGVGMIPIVIALQ